MGRILDTLKNNEPSIYWHGVDMAVRGENKQHITHVLAAMVENANERRAANGVRLIPALVF